MKITSKDWAYRLSIRDVSRYFETGKLFKFKLQENQFLNQYNRLFNSNEIKSHFNRDIQRLRLFNKFNLLRAVYNSFLSGAECVNSKEVFKETFGREWEFTDENFELLRKKAKFFSDKLKDVPVKQEEGITFSELIAMVENSRGIQIDRKMKLFEFHKIYELELKKWQTSNK